MKKELWGHREVKICLSLTADKKVKVQSSKSHFATWNFFLYERRLLRHIYQTYPTKLSRFPRILWWLECKQFLTIYPRLTIWLAVNQPHLTSSSLVFLGLSELKCLFSSKFCQSSWDYIEIHFRPRPIFRSGFLVPVALAIFNYPIKMWIKLFKVSCLYPRNYRQADFGLRSKRRKCLNTGPGAVLTEAIAVPSPASLLKHQLWIRLPHKSRHPVLFHTINHQANLHSGTGHLTV